MTERPQWADRLRREREARGWSQARAVMNLRATYARSNDGKEGGGQESLVRQWKEWESGRVRPTTWAPYIAAVFGTIEADLFPVAAPGNDLNLLQVTGMDTAELVARLQHSTISDATLHAVRVTVERLCTDYRHRNAAELRTEGQLWLRRMVRLLDERLTFSQHGDILSLAGRLALLVGCVEYDSGKRVAAESTRRFALDLAVQVGDNDVAGWAYEMGAWFAITSGDLHRTVALAEHGMETAGTRSVGAQLAAQAAKAWARLGNTRQVEVSLDRGRNILAALPVPENPDDHFVVDPAKWMFYEMDVYRNVGNDALATLYADEVLRAGTDPVGGDRSPMRTAEARITLAVVAARAGDIDAAADYGVDALRGDRHSLPSLTMVARELTNQFTAAGLNHDPRTNSFTDALLSLTAPQVRG